MEHRVQINLLERFTVWVDGLDITGQVSKSRKGISLLQYLILQQGVSVPNRQLYETLWPSDESSNPESALKTLISRMRSILGRYSQKLSRCIQTDRGAYRFQTGLDIDVDLFEFMRLDRTLSQKKDVQDEDAPLYERAVALYQGDLLSDAGTQENWATAYHIELHGIYLQLVYRYVAYLEQRENFEEVGYVCRKALEIDAFDERLHIALMNAMLKRGSINEALMQHKHATEIYYKYLGVQPTEGIQEFYKKILSADRSLDESLSYICKELKSGSANVGAFVCEYAIFKEIFNLQVRNLERVDLHIYIMLVMLHSVDGKTMEPMKLNQMMNGLQEVMRTNLRKGDVVSQFSASQFALLLPMNAKENGAIVMERVKHAFYKRYPRSSVVIRYRVSSLDKVDEISWTTSEDDR
jgi:DNA-binding SARP family transcriptional activator